MTPPPIVKTEENFWDLYKTEHSNNEYINKMNIYLYNIILTRKRYEKKKILSEFHDAVAKVTGYEERKLAAYLNNNLDGTLTDEVMEAKNPGLTSSIIESIPLLVPLLDKMIEYKTFYIFVSTIIRLIKIELQFLDLFKDLALAITCMTVVGGLDVVLLSLSNFSSFMVIVLFATVLVPQSLGKHSKKIK